MGIARYLGIPFAAVIVFIGALIAGALFANSSGEDGADFSNNLVTDLTPFVFSLDSAILAHHANGPLTPGC
jgi:hypothetical protein